MPREIEVKSVLNKTKKRDTWFLDDYTFNPYSSCAFNCLYCYIRGSKYGSNLESSLSVKMNAIEILDRQLHARAKKNQFGYIVLSSATDPYLKIEQKYELTKQALDLILKYRFPVHMITKSDLIERDFEVLKKIEKEAILPDELKEMKRGTIITFSFSTIQDEIGKIFEPGATPPIRRLKILQKCVDHDFLTGVSFMPMIPYISDTTEQLNASFQTFQKIGIDYILPATMTLFGSGKADSKTLMLGAIKKHFPELEEKYHRFFSQSHQLPKYYRDAFYKKMGEMCDAYTLKRDIFQAAKAKI